MLPLLVVFICIGGRGRNVTTGEFLGKVSADVVLARGRLTTAGE